MRGPITADVQLLVRIKNEKHFFSNKIHFEKLKLQYVFYDKSKNPGVFYEFSSKGSGGGDAGTTSNSNHTPTYNWDFIEWSDCDVKCGGGTEVHFE